SQVTGRLRSSSHATALAAVSDAVRLVLLHYLEDGELARRRYALTSTVTALRDREIVSVARYQRLFREFIAQWMPDRGQSDSPLAARPVPRSGPGSGRGHAPGHRLVHSADGGPGRSRHHRRCVPNWPADRGPATRAPTGPRRTGPVRPPEPVVHGIEYTYYLVT